MIYSMLTGYTILNLSPTIMIQQKIFPLRELNRVILFLVKVHCGRKGAFHSSKIAIQNPLFVAGATSSQQWRHASLLGLYVGRNIFGDGKSSIFWSQIECSETIPGVEHLWNTLFLDKFFHHRCVVLKRFCSKSVFRTRSWRSYVNSLSMIGVEVDARVDEVALHNFSSHHQEVVYPNPEIGSSLFL